jgi:hypothetical protein
MELTSRPGFPAFAIAFVTFADLAAGRALLRADEARVYLAGRALDLRCAFREATGLPCPTCGLSRSIVMSLHGDFARAWRMAPAGPAAVAGVALFAAAMLGLTFLQALGGARQASDARVWIRRGALAYAAALIAIWAGGWLNAFATALYAR